MIAFLNRYLVKSINFAFTYVLFRFVYNDIALSNVTVNRPELLALMPEQINLVQVMSSHLGLD